MLNSGRYLALAALLAACSFDGSGVGAMTPTPADASADGPDEPPIDGGPDGATAIDARLADAAVDARLDGDGDGRPDGEDNCPGEANANQRDHDGDGRGDLCDGCPHVDDEAVDADGDGVGNACDPRPGAADRIVLFEGFYDQGSGPPAGWVAAGVATGAWRIRDGSLEQTSNMRGVQILYWNEALGTQSVEARSRITAVAAAGPGISNTRTLGPMAGYTPASGGQGDHLWLCVLRGDVNDRSTLTQQFFELTGALVNENKSSGELAGDFVAGTEAELGMHLENRIGDSPLIEQGCRARGGVAPPVLGDSDNGVARGFAGVRTNGVQATFDYIVIIAEAMP